MKVLIVVCTIVLLLQLATVGVNLSSGSGDPPSDVEDGDWQAAEAFPLAAAFERLLDPLRKRLVLPWDEQTFPGGAGEPVEFSEGSDDQRVAKFELTAGTGVLIRYECSREGARCPQVVCLCPAGESIVLQDFISCGDAFRPRDGKCPSDGDQGELVVYGKTGEIYFAGLGSSGGTVRQR